MLPYLLRPCKNGGGIEFIRNAYVLYTPVYSYLISLEPPELFLKPEVFRRLKAGKLNSVYAEDVKTRSMSNSHIAAMCDPSTQMIYFDFKYPYEHVLARSYIAPYTQKQLAALRIPEQYAVNYKTKVISFGAETDTQITIMLLAYKKVYKLEGGTKAWIKRKGIS